jgi:roadblock/LC7 domain-containing protein
MDVTIDVVVAQGDFADFAEPVRHADGGERRAVFTDRDRHAPAVVEDMESDGFAVYRAMDTCPVAGDAAASERDSESGQGQNGDGKQS